MARLLLNLLLAIGAFCAVSAAPSESKLCSTPGCKEVAALLKNSMNRSVNPCSDFFEYTCGGWVAKHPIPDEKSRYGIIEEVEDIQTAQIKKLLESFNTKTDAKKSSASVTLAAHFYQQCLHLATEPASVALKQLSEVVRTILGNREWTIGQPVKAGQTFPKWEDNFARLFGFGAIDPIFSISIFPDPKNVSAQIINLDPAGLGLGDKDLKDLNKNPKLVKAYKMLIEKSAQLLCNGKCGSQPLQNDIDEILQLESALAKVKMPMEDFRDPEKIYNKLSLDELKAKTKFDWLNKILLPVWKNLGVTAHIDGQTKVIVSDPNYFMKAVEILEKTSTRVIDNYFGWLAVNEYSGISSESFRNIIFEFIKVNEGVTRQSERYRTCLNLANGQLNWALGRLFVDHHFTEAEKQAATAMIDEVQVAFEKLIKENDWLDAETKKASLSKLTHVRKNVAYPNWLLNNTELDKFHALENAHFANELLTSGNYILSYLKFSVNGLKKAFDALYKPIDVDKNWPMGPFIVNAAYEPEQNSITIPAGQLKSPFFNVNFPPAINFGNAGATIGHELSHGFDDEGRQFDASGNLRNWWSEKAVAEFNNRSACFVKQYSDQVDKATGLHLNGQNCLGENLADINGLKEAFLAFKNAESKNGPSPRLADLPDLSPEQLFFISYGYSWCYSYRPEALRNQIEYNVHSPPMYRVNVPVANSADFAKAFQCPVGSPMNTAEKCVLW